jgi:AAHS family 4-hydroxybenzoate transporter-like MFS transporter
MTRPLSRADRRWGIVAVCALAAFLDGFDTQSLGPAAKTIADGFHLPLASFGPVFSASQVGFLCGALVFGPLGDRFGRRRILAISVALFGLASLATAGAAGFGTLFCARLLAGVGLGGATPNFISLAADAAPERYRSRVVTMLWSAVPAGGMAGAALSGLLLVKFGWPAVFLLGGVAPLALAAVLVAAAGREEPSDGTAPRPGRAPLAALFADGGAAATLWLWLASFMTWSVLIVTAFWTPALLQKAGWSAPSAAHALALNNAGGVFGALLFGLLLTRIGAPAALGLALGGTSLCLGAIALLTASHAPVLVGAALAGFCASAAGGALLAVATEAYPPSLRATGVGWAVGVGRLGAIAGPSATGWLVGRGWEPGSIYLALAAPAALGVVCVLLLALTSRLASATPERRALP